MKMQDGLLFTAADLKAIARVGNRSIRDVLHEWGIADDALMPCVCLQAPLVKLALIQQWFSVITVGNKYFQSFSPLVFFMSGFAN